MKNNFTANLFALLGAIAVTAIFSSNAYARQGTEGVGGGDMCESTIKNIRSSLSAWIERGGHQHLTLPEDITPQEYASSMQRKIKTAQIICVSRGDAGYPVQVLGRPKTCRFDLSSAGSTITCDAEKFMTLNENEQHRIIHHEYAGLAGIELPEGSDSNYDISDQLSAYSEVVLKSTLAVRKSEPVFADNLSMTCSATAFSAGQMIATKSFRFPREGSTDNDGTGTTVGFYQVYSSTQSTSVSGRVVVDVERWVGSRVRSVATNYYALPNVGETIRMDFKYGSESLAVNCVRNPNSKPTTLRAREHYPLSKAIQCKLTVYPHRARFPTVETLALLPGSDKTIQVEGYEFAASRSAGVVKVSVKERSTQITNSFMMNPIKPYVVKEDQDGSLISYAIYERRDSYKLNLTCD